MLTGLTIAGAQLQIGQYLVVGEPFLPRHGPTHGHAGEGTPTAVAAEAGGAVATHGGCEQVAAVVGIVQTTVVRNQHMAVVAGLHRGEVFTLGVDGVVRWRRTLPVLIIVTHRCLHIAFGLIEEMGVVGIEREQSVDVLLRTVGIVQATRIEVAGGCRGHIHRAAAAGNVGA